MPETIATEPVRKSAWGQIFLLTLILFGGSLMLGVFGPLQEAAKTDMKLTDFTIGLLQGIVTGAPAAIVAVPISWLIDHGNRVRLLTALFAACVVGCIWTSFAGGMIDLSAARMLAAVGAGCALAVVISLSADLCTPDHRGRAVVLLGLGVAAGGAAAFILGGKMLHDLGAHPLKLLGSMVPWRATHLILGVAGAVLLFPLFLLREPARHEVEEAGASLRVAFRALWSKRGFLIPLFAGQLAVGMADTAAGIWATPVLVRDYHLHEYQFTTWVGAMIFVGGILGSVLGGLGADWGQKSGRRGGLLIAAVIATFLGIPAALFPVMPSLVGFQAMFFLMMFAGMVTGIVSSTAVTVLIPNEERGACMAAFGVISSLVGKSAAPLIVSLVSGAMGGDQHLAPALAVTGVVTAALSFVGYVFAMRNAPVAAAELPPAHLPSNDLAPA